MGELDLARNKVAPIKATACPRFMKVLPIVVFLLVSAGCSADVATPVPFAPMESSSALPPGAVPPAYESIAEIRTVLVDLGFFCEEPAADDEGETDGAANRVVCGSVPGEPVAGDVFILAESELSPSGIENLKSGLGVDAAGANYDGTQLVHSELASGSSGWTIMVVPGVDYSKPDIPEKIGTDPVVTRAMANKIRAVTGGGLYPG